MLSHLLFRRAVERQSERERVIGQCALHPSDSEHGIGVQAWHSWLVISGRSLCSLTLVFDWSAVALGVTALPADQEERSRYEGSWSGDSGRSDMWARLWNLGRKIMVPCWSWVIILLMISVTLSSCLEQVRIRYFSWAAFKLFDVRSDLRLRCGFQQKDE